MHFLDPSTLTFDDYATSPLLSRMWKNSACRKFGRARKDMRVRSEMVTKVCSCRVSKWRCTSCQQLLASRHLELERALICTRDDVRWTAWINLQIPSDPEVPCAPAVHTSDVLSQFQTQTPSPPRAAPAAWREVSASLAPQGCLHFFD